MKIRTSLAILAISCAGFLGWFWLDESLFSLLTSTRRTATSQAIWERLQTLGTLQVVRSIQKVVFPYDYLDPDLDFEIILSTLRRGTGTVNSLLGPRERDYLEARDLAERIGLRISGRRREFVVVTALVGIGVDLRALKIHRPTEQTIQVILPPPGIVDLTIEDPTPSTYPYPDIPLAPSSWKLVAELVERKIREHPLDPSIRSVARDRIHRFLTTLFEQAGFSGIEIEEEIPGETGGTP
ncbi:MAG: hypothetical protein Kow009_01720 [Spirochaetales bacterium]